MIRFFLLFTLLFSTFIFAKENVYFLPEQNKELYNSLEKIIKKSNTIDIMAYNFNYKKFAKVLEKQADKDTLITLILDQKKVDKEGEVTHKLCKHKNVSCKYVSNKKQHIKLMIFDKQTAFLGSLNLTKESFKENYELVFETNDQKTLKSLNKIFKEF